MQLHIRHETVYRYAEPVKRSVQNLRLTPRRDPIQRALSWTLHAPGRQHAQLDAHGNIVHLLIVNEPHREIRILVNGVVETAAAPHAALPNEGRLSPLAYLADTALTRADESIAIFARRQLGPTQPSERFLLELAHAIHVNIDEQHAYFRMVRTRWSESLRHAFHELPDPDWIRRS